MVGVATYAGRTWDDFQVDKFLPMTGSLRLLVDVPISVSQRLVGEWVRVATLAVHAEAAGTVSV